MLLLPKKSSFLWRCDKLSDLTNISMYLHAVLWVSKYWTRWVSGTLKIISYMWDLVVASPAVACKERHGVRADTSSVLQCFSYTHYLMQPKLKRQYWTADVRSAGTEMKEWVEECDTSDGLTLSIFHAQKKLFVCTFCLLPTKHSVPVSNCLNF